VVPIFFENFLSQKLMRTKSRANAANPGNQKQFGTIDNSDS
jgi:hypothetical protein